MLWTDIASLIESTLRTSTPLILAAMGGVFSERSGTINLCLEGKMLLGAFVAASVAYATHSPYLGVIAGALAASLLAGLYGFFTITLNANQVVAGTAINLLAFGLIPFICNIFFGATGSTPAIPLAERMTWEPLVCVWVLVIGLAVWFKYGASALWLRVAGDNPEALQAAGYSVLKIRWAALISAGLLAGAGGAVLSIALSSSFSRGMSAGRGFMALAAVILGKWRPFQAALACLLFAFADALQIKMQGIQFANGQTVPVQFIQMFPYFLTLIILAGFIGKSRAPAALGSRIS